LYFSDSSVDRPVKKGKYFTRFYYLFILKVYMPLLGLIKNKKKTKDQQLSSSTTNDDKESTHSSTAAAAPSSPAATKTAIDISNKKVDKVKSDQSSRTPVRTISRKTPNPFTATPVNIPKSPTLGLTAPADLEQNRMYSSSPFSTSSQQHLQQQQPPPPPPQPPPQQSPSQSQHQHQHQPHLQNVVTGQYNAPPTPPSTARSGSIDDKIDLNSNSVQSAQSSYHQQQHDQLKHPQPQQGYQQFSDATPSDAMIATPSGLLTPVPNANDRVIPSRFPSAQTGNAVRTTKGKYSIGDFSIQRTLGTGSFGRVHLVQSRHNSRFYAIKVSQCIIN
jgi:protein kinase A